MNSYRTRLLHGVVSVSAGAIMFFALLAALGVMSSYIEPGSRIDAFIAAAPQHRHPLRVAAAAWSLYLLGGVAIGLFARRVTHRHRVSPWHVLLAIAAGYFAAPLSIVPGPGALTHGALPGHAAALFVAAALCIGWHRWSSRVAER